MYATAHLQDPRSKVRPKCLSLIAGSNRTSPGINLVALIIVWDYPKNFYGEKTKIFWAKNVTFT